MLTAVSQFAVSVSPGDIEPQPGHLGALLTDCLVLLGHLGPGLHLGQETGETGGRRIKSQEKQGQGETGARRNRGQEKQEPVETGGRRNRSQQKQWAGETGARRIRGQEKQEPGERGARDERAMSREQGVGRKE